MAVFALVAVSAAHGSRHLRTSSIIVSSEERRRLRWQARFDDAGGSAMDAKRSQSLSSNALPVECHDLHRRMAEVFALREKVAALDKVRKKTRQRAKKASDSHAERRPRSVLG
jgi:hypothetical protein